MNTATSTVTASAAWQSVASGADVEVQIDSPVTLRYAYGESTPSASVLGSELPANEKLVVTLPTGTSVYVKANSLKIGKTFPVNVVAADA